MNNSKQLTRLSQLIQHLNPLLDTLKKASSIEVKLSVVNSISTVRDYLHLHHDLSSKLQTLDKKDEYLVKLMIAIGQAPIIFNRHAPLNTLKTHLRPLLDHLLEVENSYQSIGGVIGYYLTVLRLIDTRQIATSSPLENSHYIHPEGLFLTEDDPSVRQAIRWGLEALPKMGEIYPVGGSGDRLNMIDQMSGKPLPAAVLPFAGFSLLENLIRDLQAREYLYFKIYDQQVFTPLAMMTSTEKNNHAHILSICKSHRWFGRPSSSYQFFDQPLVPVITEEGNFSLSDFYTLTLKPGGHGVLWKLAEEHKIFGWLASSERYDCLVRQINNPLAGLDFALLALSGIGNHEKKSMGFLSCERLLKSAEGMNVLIETQGAKGFEYRLTNIEYTDFAKKGVVDEPANPDSPYSIYPTNTNILFVHLPAIQNALKICPIPGQLINMKTKVPFIDSDGHRREVAGGRLETTMQNIADVIVDTVPHKLDKEETRKALQTFIVYNDRIKTISTTKVSYHPGSTLMSTPEQAYYDLQLNHMNLLQEHCKFNLPSIRTVQDYLEEGPSVHLSYHPALGPLYSVIGQKIRQGAFARDSELLLEIAEVDIEKLDLEGSLIITSPSPLGSLDQHEILNYGNESRCTLHHVTIRNLGIDRLAPNVFWKHQINRHESCQIILGEGAEFHAENIVLEGYCRFEVPARHRLVVKSNGPNGWKEELTSIEGPTWKWNYAFDSEDRIKLSRD